MKPVVITVNGTGVPDPFGPGFAGDVGRAFAWNPWDAIAAELDGTRYDTTAGWQPIGYPAATFPMWPSINAGRAEVNRQIGRRPKGTPLFLSGYSQGAIVTGKVWSEDILAPDGVHHDRLPDVRGIINFGDPLRSPGIAHGNTVAGLPQPTKLDGSITGGIAGKHDLKPDQTPDFLLSCALDGDLYAAAPVNSDPWSHEANTGTIETAIYDIVLFRSPMSLFEIVDIIAALFTNPINEIIAIVQAIINGITFAAAGTHAPHWQYQPFVPHMVDWILDRLDSPAAAA